MFDEHIAYLMIELAKTMGHSYKAQVESTRDTLDVTTPIFFSHSGNTDATKFSKCDQDSYTTLYKKFRASSTTFIYLPAPPH